MNNFNLFCYCHVTCNHIYKRKSRRRRRRRRRRRKRRRKWRRRRKRWRKMRKWWRKRRKRRRERSKKRVCRKKRRGGGGRIVITEQKTYCVILDYTLAIHIPTVHTDICWYMYMYVCVSVTEQTMRQGEWNARKQTNREPSQFQTHCNYHRNYLQLASTYILYMHTSPTASIQDTINVSTNRHIQYTSKRMHQTRLGGTD